MDYALAFLPNTVNANANKQGSSSKKNEASKRRKVVTKAVEAKLEELKEDKGRELTLKELVLFPTTCKSCFWHGLLGRNLGYIVCPRCGNNTCF